MSTTKWTASHMRLSPSKINTYLKCPREFYYNYIAKLPQKKTIHLFRGTLVNQILEDLFKKQFKTLHNGRKEFLNSGYRVNLRMVGKKR